MAPYQGRDSDPFSHRLCLLGKLVVADSPASPHRLLLYAMDQLALSA